jgi:hypothetical protein
VSLELIISPTKSFNFLNISAVASPLFPLSFLGLHIFLKPFHLLPGLAQKHFHVCGCPREDNMGMLVLCFNALDLLMHGYLLSEDDEESPICRSEEL